MMTVNFKRALLVTALISAWPFAAFSAGRNPAAVSSVEDLAPNRSNVYFGIGSSLLLEKGMGAEVGYALPIQRNLAVDARIRFVRSSYRALFGQPTERERTDYPSGAWDAPSSEFNRARGDDDSWGGTQASIGLSLTEHWSRTRPTTWMRSMRVAFGRQMLSDNVNGLDFSGWFFSIEAGVPYRFPKSRWYLAPVVEAKWGWVNRSDLPKSQETRLSSRELEAALRLGFLL
jgi:hypothetical protein